MCSGTSVGWEVQHALCPDLGSCLWAAPCGSVPWSLQHPRQAWELLGIVIIVTGQNSTRKHYNSFINANNWFSAVSWILWFTGIPLAAFTGRLNFAFHTSQIYFIIFYRGSGVLYSILIYCSLFHVNSTIHLKFRDNFFIFPNPLSDLVSF